MGLLERLAGLFGRRRSVVVVADAPVRHPEPEAVAGGDAERAVRQICSEALFARRGWRTKLTDSRRWGGLKDQSPELQAAVLMVAAEGRVADESQFRREHWAAHEIQKAIVSNLLRRSLPLSPDQLVRLLEAWLKQPYSLENGLPGLSLLTAVERYAAASELTPALGKMLQRVRRRAAGMPDRFSQGVASRVEGLLNPQADGALDLPKGAFGKALRTWLETVPDAERAGWRAVLHVAADAGDKSQPTAKWLAAARAAAAALDRARLTAQVLAWIEETTPDPKRPDISLDVLKGLVWLTSLLEPAEAVGRSDALPTAASARSRASVRDQ